MKIGKIALAIGLLVSLGACGHKSNTIVDDGVSAPFSWHVAADCPASLAGTWDFSAPDSTGASVAMRATFAVNSKGQLTFNRISQENLTWVFDGYIHTTTTGENVALYCEAADVVVQIEASDMTAESLVFTFSGGTLTLKDVRSQGLLIDHNTLALYIADSSFPTISCTKEP